MIVNLLLLDVTLILINLKTINKTNILYNILVSHRDLKFIDLRFKGGNDLYKRMTTRRMYTQTRSVKHSNDMYDPDNVKCLF